MTTTYPIEHVTILDGYDFASQMGDAIECEACFGIVADAATGGTPSAMALDHYVEHLHFSRESLAEAQRLVEAKVRAYLNS